MADDDTIDPRIERRLAREALAFENANAPKPPALTLIDQRAEKRRREHATEERIAAAKARLASKAGRPRLRGTLSILHPEQE